MKINKADLVAGSSIVASGLVLLLLLTGSSLAPRSEKNGTDQISVLQTPQTWRDVPQDVDLSAHGVNGLLPESARLVGVSEEFSGWAALDEERRICVLVQLTDRIQTSAATCTSPDDFAKHGLGLRVAGAAESGVDLVLYLLPDGYVGQQSEGKEWRALSANLIVRTGFDQPEFAIRPLDVVEPAAALDTLDLYPINW